MPSHATILRSIRAYQRAGKEGKARRKGAAEKQRVELLRRHSIFTNFSKYVGRFQFIYLFSLFVFFGGEMHNV